MSGVQIGTVTHFYARIMVAVVKLSQGVAVGDDIHILGRTTDFRQPILSLQIEHQSVDVAGPGQEVALKVKQRVRRGDKVFKLDAEA
jgi:putative protease